MSAEEWHNLYERIADADLRKESSHIPSLKDLVETNPSKLTRNDTIPLGIIDMEAATTISKRMSMCGSWNAYRRRWNSTYPHQRP